MITEIRNFRPKFHFTPPTMWMNDPNGLVYENKTYHLFYQYNPFSNLWGPMHWGHAISSDLLKWQHLPLALYPDELGTIFSGSAVYDSLNTSGFGDNGKYPIVTMFTHNGQSQQQSIAYSIDGVNFFKYKENPVIVNPGIKDFRDPKVFLNNVGKCWGMVVSCGDRVMFYSSPDLKKWEKSGEFGPNVNNAMGVWECPDFFPMKIGDIEVWILLVSMVMPTDKGGSRIRYFIGRFNGNKFLCDKLGNEPLWLDEGFDNYAGVTYNNTVDRILIGWENNWQYAKSAPTTEFRGVLTLPRKLSLIDTELSGLRLACLPVNLENYISDVAPLANGADISDESFWLTIKGCGTSEIILSNSEGQSLKFGVNKKNELFVDRSHAGETAFSTIFASSLYGKKSARRHFRGSYRLEAIFDVSTLELFIDEGTLSMSIVVFPSSAYSTVNISGDVKIEYKNINR